MPFGRRVSLAVVSGVAGAWAGAMVMCGLWVMYSVPLRWSVQHRTLCDLVGVGLVAGGQMVFMMMVADRIFPRANRALASILEAGCFLIFLVGLGYASWVAATGGGR